MDGSVVDLFDDVALLEGAGGGAIVIDAADQNGTKLRTI